MVIFDTTFLTFLFIPSAPCAVDRPRDRIQYLIGDLQGQGERIGVPTPVLAELLIKTGHSTNQILYELNRAHRFVILPFDTIAAIELAMISRQQAAKGNKRGDSKGESWAKVKFDRQIVAIARVQQARTIYSEDPGLTNLAEALGIEARGIKDCKLPPPSAQMSMDEGLFSRMATEHEADASRVPGSSENSKSEPSPKQNKHQSPKKRSNVKADEK